MEISYGEEHITNTVKKQTDGKNTKTSLDMEVLLLLLNRPLKVMNARAKVEFDEKDNLQNSATLNLTLISKDSIKLNQAAGALNKKQSPSLTKPSGKSENKATNPPSTIIKGKIS